MVEADSHLSLLPVYILDISKVFVHIIDMLFIGLRDIGLGDVLDGDNVDENINVVPRCCAAYYRDWWAPPPPKSLRNGHNVGRRMMVEVLPRGIVRAALTMTATTVGAE